MLRRVVGAVFVLVLCVSFTLADEFIASITKVEGGKVTFIQFKGKEKGPEKTLPVADNVKVVKGTFNKETKKSEPGDAIEGGLKNKMFSEISEKGVFSGIVTDADNSKITEIRVLPKFGKKKDQ